MRGPLKIALMSEEDNAIVEQERRVDIPYWMREFAAKAEQFVKQEEIRKEAVTVVDHVRERQQSMYEQMYSIMNGKKPLYSSVEEAVSDYQKKTGLIDHLQKIQADQNLTAIAQQILSVDEEKKNSEKPKVLESFPVVENYIDNVIRSNPHLSVPAIIHMLAENFENDGVDTVMLNDPELARYISSKISEHLTPNTDNYSAIGTGLDISYENDDPFAILRGV